MTLGISNAKKSRMRLTRLTASLMTGHLLMALGALGAESAALEKVGLAIGSKAPAFTLKDQNGREVSLDSLLKKGPTALVFYRSADW